MQSNFDPATFRYFRDVRIAAMYTHIMKKTGCSQDEAMRFVLNSETCKLLCKQETEMWLNPETEAIYLIDREYEGDWVAWKNQVNPQ